MTKNGSVKPLIIFLALLSLTSCRPGAEAAREGGTATTSGTMPSPDDGRTAAADFSDIPAIVREVEPSVVAVLTGSGEGSGVIWRTDGLILTNHHVVVGAGSIELAFADGKRADAEVIATDPLTDLALLRTARRDLPAASFADELPEVGELAVAIGNPLGFENTVTAGVISGLHRSIPGSARHTQALIDLVQTDAAISPGNSGGALVGGDSEVVGINVAYIPPEARAVSIGFAIPSPTVIDVAEQLLAHGTVRHSFFGIQPGALSPQVARLLDVEADGGTLVLEVVAGGPAAAAGIRAGDVIVSINGADVRSVEGFLSAVRRHEPGDRMEVGVLRDGQRQTVTLVLAERPAG